MLRILRQNREPAPILGAGGGGWFILGLLCSVALEVLLARSPGMFSVSGAAGRVWAAKLQEFNRTVSLLWMVTGLWGMALAGWEHSRYIFAGGMMVFLSRYIVWDRLPAFHAWLGRYVPAAATLLYADYKAFGLVNLVPLFAVAGYVAYHVQDRLWRLTGWEGHARRQWEKERMLAATGPAQAGYGQVAAQAAQHAGLSIPGVSVYPRKQPDPKALDRIVGLDEAKKLVMRTMRAALDTSGVYAQYGLAPPGGILLYGPPGTGKTSFARACAEALGCTFYVVNASAVVGSLVGQTERAISYLFQHARANRPAVIFWDEIDAVARKRDSANLNRPSDLVLNVLLSEMDGFQSKGEKGVLVIGATNRIDVLDPAILRPGRFDHKVEVGLPDARARVQLLEFFLRGRKTAGIDGSVLEELAAATEGWSPADLKALVDEAAWAAVEAGKPIDPRFLKQVLEKSRTVKG
ncbi:ATPase family associated with various cellular activities (AAA) [Thermanaeromonas toyohensis ToBE]|uniref:ATPase family associated with various cellular activities (AAA) n=1 Tax=Thermanaeromonas toyohensis ToBE TaxID=698762 RepID=A0A1W1VT13_9FIRM|nr:AAA family ATPase [Thermanaeromonas toyohensis]SMB96370.1 ATPase family associated with various cellular activities (AAA) [Thermanaeromonas toyohensis ToBE]